MFRKQTHNRYRRGKGLHYALLALTLCLVALLAAIIVTIPENSHELAAAVIRLQQESGVESPVTAVLLNFRGYDTLLEVMVLLLAVIGARSLLKSPYPKQLMDTGPVQMGVVRLLAPLMCLIAAYLVWQGSHLAGGAFQGGALLGAAGVLLLVAELPGLQTLTTQQIRIGLVFGPLSFLGVALLCLFCTGNFLGYPEKTAGWLILFIEITCAISIGITLAALFAGGHLEGDGSVEQSANGEKP